MQRYTLPARYVVKVMVMQCFECMHRMHVQKTTHVTYGSVWVCSACNINIGAVCDMVVVLDVCKARNVCKWLNNYV